MEQWGYPKLNQKKSKNTFSKRGEDGHPSSGNVRQTVLNRLPPQRDWLKYIQFFGVSHKKTKPTYFGIEPSVKSILSYLRIIQSHMMSLLCYCDICPVPSSPATPLNVSKTICNFQPIHGQTWTRWTVKCGHFLSDPGPIIVCPCQWLTDSLTDPWGFSSAGIDRKYREKDA